MFLELLFVGHFTDVTDVLTKNVVHFCSSEMIFKQSSLIARLGSQASSRLPLAALLIWLMCWSAAFQHRWSLKWKILNQGIEKSYIKGIKYGSPPIISNPWICLFPCYLWILKRQVQNHKQDIPTRQSNKNHQKSLVFGAGPGRHALMTLDGQDWEGCSLHELMYYLLCQFSLIRECEYNRYMQVHILRI